MKKTHFLTTAVLVLLFATTGCSKDGGLNDYTSLDAAVQSASYVYFEELPDPNGMIMQAGTSPACFENGDSDPRADLRDGYTYDQVPFQLYFFKATHYMIQGFLCDANGYAITVGGVKQYINVAVQDVRGLLTTTDNYNVHKYHFIKGAILYSPTADVNHSKLINVNPLSSTYFVLANH